MHHGEKLIDRPCAGAWSAVAAPGRWGTSTEPERCATTPPIKWFAAPSTSTSSAARTSGRTSGSPENRLYPDYRTLIAEEAKRTDGVEVVTIATPNFTHYEITKACLEAGLHVICEKPLFFTVRECEEIATLADAKSLIVGVTYGFTGHPLVHQMAAMVKKGMLGDIRIVDLQYTHGFNSGDDANASEAQKWRTNPKTSGPTFVLGDIGTHLYYLSEIVLPHMKIEKLLCDRQSFIKSRAPLEDNAYVLSHYDNGAVGRLWVSSVNAGNMASQRYRFVGSKASLEWTDTQPNELIYEIQGQPPQIMHHGMPYLEEESLAVDRMGALHTEGLGDSWANIYLWIAQAIDAKKRGDETFLKDSPLPGHRGRHRGRALARELRAFRRGRLGLG